MKMYRHLLIGVVFIAGNVFSQSTQVGKTSNAINRLIQRLHYQSKPLDDSLSTYVFHKFIDAIDPSGYQFLKSDIDFLKSEHEFQIDDQIASKTSDFFDDVAKIFYQRLKSSDSIINVISAEAFDFDKKEYIDYTLDEELYVNNYKALSERWRKWLKSSVLEELFEGAYFNDADRTSLDSLREMIPEATEVVVEYEKFDIHSFIDHPSGYRAYLATYFLDAMAGYYDPHTTYFSDIDKSNFEDELSKDNYAFGFSLKEDSRGRIFIAGMTPGGAAWMSNAINQDDQIMAVKFEKGKSVDVTLHSLDELMLIFDSKNSEKLLLTLKKANGRIEEVELIKSEVYVDQDVIKSVILKGDKKIGYITLPDFYTDWSETTGLGCANDIAKNIVKLKQENIDGLILDLRNNGGGSLKEAIDLAGIFINYGPITVEVGKYREPKTLKDMNKGAIYLGPFVILVNGLSASASEIFSAAMQDYNRAIVLGSQTYGKSTGQIVLPLDPVYKLSFDNMEDVDPKFGYLKITRSKFYRITNETHQKEGVVPDITLRDYYELYDYAEALNETALSKDRIEKKMYYTSLPELPFSKLQSNSSFRMSSNIFYQELCSVIDSISNFDSYYDIVPLSLADFQNNERIMNDLYDQLFSEELGVSDHFEVTNNQFDAEIMKMNNYRAELNEKYLNKVSKDLYIAEAYNVLVDYIQMKN
jgi:carboxyl-terminal processing protease